ncbi:MAG: hypothetical protein HYX25_03570 [Candidatus Solibacter usitatus]|nr:hypothetical protein [Candidatus Solibacter usitatus]
MLAAEAPVGVVFRRGPSKLVRVIVWNRAKDKFKPGTWFKGRIFADRSDLSPDGRYMIYFAMGGVAWAIPATGGTWTAISLLHSLKATALWGQGDTWGGGGWFTSNRSFWLDAVRTTFLIRDNSGLRRESKRPRQSRMERDGWMSKKGSLDSPVFEKTVRAGWILRRIGWSGGYELEQPGECKLAFPAWEWADWDRRRLVWAESGCLLTARLGSQKLGTVRTLFDFNRMVPVLQKNTRPKTSPAP